MRDLMMRFASLGDNCELGVAQRDHGANPMDLLRWAITPAEVLLQMVREDFTGIGENLKVKDHRGAFLVTNEHYGFTWHDWTRKESASGEEIAAREARRLPALAAKLRKELRENARIFVVKQTKQIMPEGLPEQIHEAMSAYGVPVLLHVTQGAPVSVSEIRPRLLHGTIPQFALPAQVPRTTNSADWLELCKAVAALVDERYPAPQPAPEMSVQVGAVVG